MLLAKVSYYNNWFQIGKGVRQGCILLFCLFNLYAEWSKMKWNEVKVIQLCPTLCNPMDYTVHGIIQIRILEQVTLPFPSGSSQLRGRTQVSRIAGGFFTSWATREALYAEYITWNAGLDEAQAGIKIVGRNINNLRYADDTILMAKSKEELKTLLMKLKEEREKVGLKLSIQKAKIMVYSPITS